MPELKKSELWMRMKKHPEGYKHHIHWKAWAALYVSIFFSVLVTFTVQLFSPSIYVTFAIVLPFAAVIMLILLWLYAQRIEKPFWDAKQRAQLR
jgi:ABC-type uncharacterized transport system permease subunit